MQEELFLKYKIVTDTNLRGFPTVKIYNMGAKKWSGIPKFNYYFQNEQKRDEWIADMKRRWQSWEDRKRERREQRKNFVNPAQVGDILYSDWGYDQTNINFYQVTKVIGKMVEVKEIGGRSVEGSTYSHGMADSVIPAKGRFIENREPIVRKAKESSDGYCLDIDKVQTAFLTDEKTSHYRSWYA